MKYIYLVVEGPHDISAIGRLLKSKNLQMIKNINHLDAFWLEKRMIPRDFPIEGDLLKRVPVPTFYQSETLSIAIHSAGGDSKIVSTMNLTFANVDYDDFYSYALFIDADSKNALDRLESLDVKDLPLINEITLPGQIIIRNNVKAGIFIFPNNEDKGTLETVLLSCAELVYPSLLGPAKEYVTSTDITYQQDWGQSDFEKIIVGCIANVLKPGKANQVSIQDNKWISQETLASQNLKRLNDFIDALIS